MKAMTRDDYGSPKRLMLAEVPLPQVSDDGVLIKVAASSVNAGDMHLLYGTPLLLRFIFGGLFRPTIKILGSDFAGCVVQVGKNIRKFAVGDEVFGDLSENRFGAFAEYVCAPEKAIAHKPVDVSFGAAGVAPSAAIAALQALRDYGDILPGQAVLVNGASGGVGSFAVQIAKAKGAVVTGVCSTSKMVAVRSLGAHHVIDYTQSDFAEEKDRYDLLIDAAAFRPVSELLPSLKVGGTYVMVGGSTLALLQTMLWGWWFSKRSGRNVKSLMKRMRQVDLEAVSDLLASGKIRPHIDRTFALAKLADAFSHVEARRVIGKVAIQTPDYEATETH